jgi:hypothetical protein
MLRGLLPSSNNLLIQSNLSAPWLDDAPPGAPNTTSTMPLVIKFDQSAAPAELVQAPFEIFQNLSEN